MGAAGADAAGATGATGIEGATYSGREGGSGRSGTITGGGDDSAGASLAACTARSRTSLTSTFTC